MSEEEGGFARQARALTDRNFERQRQDLKRLQAHEMKARQDARAREVRAFAERVGYPILVSPFAQYIITQAVMNVVQGERYKTIPDEVRKYAMGYYGRLAAQPSAEFLERAKLKPGELVSERPGEHVAPGLPRLRRELGAAASDEDLLLAAFYSPELIAPLKKPAP